MTPDQVTALANPAVDPAQAALDLRGYGTAATGGLVDRYGQTFGGGKNADSYLADIQKYDPNAQWVDQTNSEGSYSGSILQYDINKLPKGAAQAMTGAGGGVELSDPDSQWGTGPTRIIDPNAVNNDPIYGRSTGMQNIYQMPDEARDVGFWGPLLMSLVTMGAGAAAGGGAIFAGMDAPQLANAGLSIGRGLTDGSGLNTGTLAGIAGGMTGIPGGSTIASTIANLVSSGQISPGAAAGVLPQIMHLVNGGGG